MDQPNTHQTAPSERSQEFVPVEGGTETTSASALLVAAYVVMWALVLSFVYLTWRRQQRLDRRLVELDRALGSGGGDAKSLASKGE